MDGAAKCQKLHWVVKCCTAAGQNFALPVMVICVVLFSHAMGDGSLN